MNSLGYFKFSALLAVISLGLSCSGVGYAQAAHDTDNHAQVENSSAEGKKATRIIALAPHIVENLFTIGAGHLIVGTTDFSDYPEQAKQIPVIGNYATLSVEKILSLKPDLVIAWRTGNPPADLEKLKKYGIKVVYSHPVELTDVANELLWLGELTGHQAKATQQANQFKQRLTSLQSTYRGLQAMDVFYELWPQPLTTVAKQSWLQKQLDVCSANNPFVDSETDYPQVNLEQVVLSQPQVIIRPSSVANNANFANHWRQWTTIPAVQKNRFIITNADRSHRTSVRVLDEINVLCKQLDSYRKQLVAKPNQ